MTDSRQIGCGRVSFGILQQLFLTSFQMLTLEEVQSLTPVVRRPLGRFEGYVLAADQMHRVLSVRHQDADLFPAFQWHDGSLIQAVSAVCRIFDREFSQWDTALWLMTSTGWLGGRRPVDLLVRDPIEVVLAAHFKLMRDRLLMVRANRTQFSRKRSVL